MDIITGYDLLNGYYYYWMDRLLLAIIYIYNYIYT